MELVDTVCKNFEDYAQAKTKSSGEPVIIRSGGLQAFRFWIRSRIWIRIQHKNGIQKSYIQRQTRHNQVRSQDFCL
jgi:hypothetical protein